MKILVIGGCGFIGRHLSAKLLERGFEVVSLGRCTHPVRQHIRHPSITYVRGDVCDKVAMARVVGECDAVLGTFNVLDAARAKAAPVLYKSACEVYGEVPAPDIASEAYRLAPRSPYSSSKVAAELYCRSYATTFGMPVTITRGFNTFGPHQSSAQYGAVIPKFIKGLLEGKAPVIFGDGLQTRDYVYVEDVAEADCMILERLISGNLESGEVFNVCTGKENRIIDIARSLSALMGRTNANPVHAPRRPGEVRRNVGSFEKIHEFMGWTPRIDFQKGLEMTVRWYEAQIAGQR